MLSPDQISGAPSFPRSLFPSFREESNNSNLEGDLIIGDDATGREEVILRCSPLPLESLDSLGWMDALFVLTRESGPVYSPFGDTN